MSFLLYRVNGSKATHGSHTKNRQRIFVLFVTISNPCFAYMYFFRREKPEHDQGIRGNDRVTLWWAGASGPEIAGGHNLFTRCLALFAKRANLSSRLGRSLAGGHAFGLHNHRVARQRPSDTLVGWCQWPGNSRWPPFRLHNRWVARQWLSDTLVAWWWLVGGPEIAGGHCLKRVDSPRVFCE
jgi:hypothetical protein